MAKRHDNALFIQAGACNGLGISKALADAYSEAWAEEIGTTATNKDQAVRLILHQLCHLAGIDADGYRELKSIAAGGFDWDIAYQYCIDQASTDVLSACGIKPERVTKGLEGLHYESVFQQAVWLALADDATMSTSRFHSNYAAWMQSAATQLRAETLPMPPLEIPSPPRHAPPPGIMALFGGLVGLLLGRA